MNRHVERKSVWAFLFALACAVAVTTSACGGSSLSSSDGGSPGMCSANVPAGQACNAIANAAPPIAPNCVTGTLPTGTGGVIADGTYVLTAQTYYNESACPNVRLSETITIAGDCLQVTFDLFESGSTAPSLTGTGSTSAMVQGNAITLMPTCTDLGTSSTMQDTPTKTYTATDTTLTLFTLNTGTGSTNPDRVELLNRR